MRLNPFLLIGSLLLASSIAGATSHQTASIQKNKLAHLNTSIQSLQKTIHLTEAQKQKAQHELEMTEQNIGETAKKLRTTLSRLKQEEHLLQQTRLQHDHYRETLKQQEILLKQHIRAAYLLGRQQYLKMLLNQEDPEKMSRYIIYYHAITKARLGIIHDVQRTLINLNRTALELQQQTTHLNQTRSEQQHESNTLLYAHTTRQQLLHTLNASINTKQQQLQKLLQDKANLEHVVRQVQYTNFFFPAPGTDFEKARGQLPWPVKGPLLQTFNQLIADGRLHSNGILIKAPTGTPVRAIFNGKVVFAHWLRGFGLLVIIQHGRHYMTLYAHAESLYVKADDNVKAGDVIATIGDSGGLQQSALYFEVRHEDQPSNPLSWLKR